MGRFKNRDRNNNWNYRVCKMNGNRVEKDQYVNQKM